MSGMVVVVVVVVVPCVCAVVWSMYVISCDPGAPTAKCSPLSDMDTE